MSESSKPGEDPGHGKQCECLLCDSRRVLVETGIDRNAFGEAVTEPSREQESPMDEAKRLTRAFTADRWDEMALCGQFLRMIESRDQARADVRAHEEMAKELLRAKDEREKHWWTESQRLAGLIQEYEPKARRVAQLEREIAEKETEVKRMAEDHHKLGRWPDCPRCTAMFVADDLVCGANARAEAAEARIELLEQERKPMLMATTQVAALAARVAALEKERDHWKAKHKLLGDAVNESDLPCLPGCDRHAHEEDCPHVSMAASLSELQRQKKKAEQHATELIVALRALVNANLYSDAGGVVYVRDCPKAQAAEALLGDSQPAQKEKPMKPDATCPICGNTYEYFSDLRLHRQAIAKCAELPCAEPAREPLTVDSFLRDVGPERAQWPLVLPSQQELMARVAQLEREIAEKDQRARLLEHELGNAKGERDELQKDCDDLFERQQEHARLRDEAEGFKDCEGEACGACLRCLGIMHADELRKREKAEKEARALRAALRKIRLSFGHPVYGGTHHMLCNWNNKPGAPGQTYCNCGLNDVEALLSAGEHDQEGTKAP